MTRDESVNRIESINLLVSVQELYSITIQSRSIISISVFVCSLLTHVVMCFFLSTSDLDASGPTPVCVYMRDEVRLALDLCTSLLKSALPQNDFIYFILNEKS